MDHLYALMRLPAREEVTELCMLIQPHPFITTEGLTLSIILTNKFQVTSELGFEPVLPQH
jgi:hypothetical protein